VKVAVNQKVTKGKLIAELDMPGVEFEYKVSKENLVRAKLDLDSAESKFQTKRTLNQENMISPKEFAEDERALERTRSTYRSAYLQYIRNQERYIKRRVVSPSDGTVYRINVTQDVDVRPGHEIAVIVPDMKRLNLVISVDEADIGLVRKGQQVTFSASAHAQKVFLGEIKQINMNPQRENSITTYLAYAKCDNRDELLFPGMNVTGFVHVAFRKDVLAVPVEALFISPVPVEKKPGEQIVWVKSGGGFRKVVIQPGLMGNSYAEVAGGSLKPGDEVLIAITRGKKKTGVNIIQ
jgi:HlyD family secretion protein